MSERTGRGRIVLGLWALATWGCGASRASLSAAQAESEATAILQGKNYASERAGEDILVEELANACRQGKPTEKLLQAASERKKLTWDPDWLVFRVAALDDFVRPGFSASEVPLRVRALGKFGHVSADLQEGSRACVTRAPDEVALPIYDMTRSAVEFAYFYKDEAAAGALQFYGSAFFNRDLATESAFAAACAKPASYFEGNLVAQGFLRMRPLGQRKASAEQKSALTLLQATQPQNAALLFLGWPTPHKAEELQDMGFSTTKLQTTLTELEASYPNSLCLKTRQVEGNALLETDPEKSREQLRKLGHRWERMVWTTRANLPFPELAESWSELPACAVGAEKAQLEQGPEQGENLRIQVTDLLLRGQFRTLEALFQQLQAANDPRLELAYWGCLGSAEDRKACILALADWTSAHPKSSIAPIASALAAATDPVQRRWVLPPPARRAEVQDLGRRGSAAGNMDAQASAALLVAELGQGSSPESQLTLVSNSLKKDFLTDQSLELLVDLAPDMKGQALKQLADQLQKLLKDDLSYARVLGRALNTRGLDVSTVDWSRFSASLRRMKGRSGYTPAWAVDLLATLVRLERRQEAALLVPLCTQPAWAGSWRQPLLYRRLVAWAQRGGANPLGPQSVRPGRCYVTDRGRRQGQKGVAVLDAEFGFEVDFQRPISQRHLWRVVVNHPSIVSLGAPPQTRSQRPFLVTPDDESTIFVGYAMRQDYQVKPGTWTIRLEEAESHKLVAEKAFQLR
ncbi:DUF3859 domain-containing protein [bacterium]|nr:DUF3859 domain-containing protein [bacterium]